MNRKYFSQAFLLYSLLITILLSACQSHERENAGSADDAMPLASEYYSPAELDSLMVDIVTYIGRKPAHAESHTRFDTIHRAYYRSMAAQFEMVYYSVEDGIHIFYLLRPARSLQGNKRGVLGSFRLDEQNRITEFREWVNTPVGSDEELLEKGKRLFGTYKVTQDLADFLADTSLVEWPDGRLYYDTLRFEWRYPETE